MRVVPVAERGVGANVFLHLCFGVVCALLGIFSFLGGFFFTLLFGKVSWVTYVGALLVGVGTTMSWVDQYRRLGWMP